MIADKVDLLEVLETRKTYATDYGYSYLDIPFDLKPDDFFHLAEENLKEGNIVDSITDIKRCIECQVDCLLHSFGLYDMSKREGWNFPKKVEFLGGLNIVAPRVLRKINATRNKLEHAYRKPNQGFVEDALDIAILFSKYAERYWKDFIANPNVIFNDDKELVSLNLVPSEGRFEISYARQSEDSSYIYPQITAFEITAQEPEFLRVLKYYLGIYSPYEGEKKTEER